MNMQSNSANLEQMDTSELAAHLGQLRLDACEPHRELIVFRLTEAGKEIGTGAPLVLLLRMLGSLGSQPQRGEQPSTIASVGSTAPNDTEVAFAR